MLPDVFRSIGAVVNGAQDLGAIYGIKPQAPSGFRFTSPFNYDSTMARPVDEPGYGRAIDPPGLGATVEPTASLNEAEGDVFDFGGGARRTRDKAMADYSAAMGQKAPRRQMGLRTADLLGALFSGLLGGADGIRGYASGKMANYQQALAQDAEDDRLRREAAERNYAMQMALSQEMQRQADLAQARVWQQQDADRLAVDRAGERQQGLAEAAANLLLKSQSPSDLALLPHALDMIGAPPIPQAAYDDARSAFATQDDDLNRRRDLATTAQLLGQFQAGDQPIREMIAPLLGSLLPNPIPAGALLPGSLEESRRARTQTEESTRELKVAALDLGNIAKRQNIALTKKQLERADLELRYLPRKLAAELAYSTLQAQSLKQTIANSKGQDARSATTTLAQIYGRQLSRIDETLEGLTTQLTMARQQDVPQIKEQIKGVQEAKRILMNNIKDLENRLRTRAALTGEINPPTGKGGNNGKGGKGGKGVKTPNGSHIEEE